MSDQIEEAAEAAAEIEERCSGIEEPDYSKAPPVAYPHWYRGDLTLEQAQELFPVGCKVRMMRGGGRLLGGMIGEVVGHFQDKDAVMTCFGGRAELRVRFTREDSQAVANAIGAAIGFGLPAIPTQRISSPFRECVRIDAEPAANTLGEDLEEACTCAHAGKCAACIEVAGVFAESERHGN